MKKIILLGGLVLMGLSGCVVEPLRPAYYQPAPAYYVGGPVYYGGGYYHHWR